MYSEQTFLYDNQKVDLQKGQFITGRHKIEEEFNRGVKKSNKVSGSTLFRWLELFQECEMLNIKKTPKYTIITVLNWSKYQCNEQELNSSCTTVEQELNSSCTQYKKEKNDKKEKNINTYAQSDCKQSSMLEVNAVISLTLNDKTEYPITEEKVNEWKELYPAVDVIQELRKMKGWLDANPSKRKTRRGILKFVNSWLSRAQDKGGSGNIQNRSSVNEYPEL